MAKLDVYYKEKKPKIYETCKARVQRDGFLDLARRLHGVFLELYPKCECGPDVDVKGSPVPWVRIRTQRSRKGEAQTEMEMLTGKDRDLQTLFDSATGYTPALVVAILAAAGIEVNVKPRRFPSAGKGDLGPGIVIGHAPSKAAESASASAPLSHATDSAASPQLPAPARNAQSGSSDEAARKQLEAMPQDVAPKRTPKTDTANARPERAGLPSPLGQPLFSPSPALPQSPVDQSADGGAEGSSAQERGGGGDGGGGGGEVSNHSDAVSQDELADTLEPLPEEHVMTVMEEEEVDPATLAGNAPSAAGPSGRGANAEATGGAEGSQQPGDNAFDVDSFINYDGNSFGEGDEADQRRLCGR